ncbi:MAG: alpha/beta hydrolase [Phycisphaerales bacterium]
MKRFVTRLALGLCLVLPSSFASAQLETYTYAQINGVPIQLDLRRPASDHPTPLIIWIHGGGWLGGTRVLPSFLETFLDDGYAIAGIDYRLTSQAGQWNGASVTWPAQIHDCKGAVRWLRAHADSLNLDPCAFIVWGSSAGGHLSAVLGTSNSDPLLEGTVGDFDNVSSDIQLAVDYFGPADLLFMNPDVTDPPGSIIDHDDVNSPESILLGSATTGVSVGQIRAHLGDPNSPWPALVQLARSASPARLAQQPAGNVPMFIAHGEQDTSVPFAQSVRLRDALTAVGDDVAFRPVPDVGHGLATFPTEIADEVKVWLDVQLAALPPCGCIADLTGDGTLNFADVVFFLNDFAAQKPSADFALPIGLWDFSDVVAFLVAFASGCP